MRLVGHLDRCDTEGLGGWVVDRDDPENAIELQIFMDGNRIGLCEAAEYRQDLADADIRQGYAAFRFTFDPRLDEARIETLEIRIGSTGYEFTSLHRRPFPASAAAERAPAQVLVRPKRFRQCILHIGTEKTGSTSIQAMLANNRDVLRDAGYFFPESLCQTRDKSDGNHRHIAAMAMRDDAFDHDLRGQWGVKDADSLAAYRLSQARAFDKEIAESAGDCTKLLLSNEHCHSRLLTVQEVARVRELLERYCDEFKIVVYLRPQFELALSQYGMMVLNGYYDIEALPPLPYPADYAKRRYTNELYFDYEKLLTRWATVFGAEAIEPRLYAAAGASRKSPTMDFLEVLGQSETAFVQPARENTNISAPAQEFLIKLYSEFAARGYSPWDSWANPIRAVMRRLHPGSGYKPAQGEIRVFQQRFEKSNEAVRAQWFPKREQLFDEDYAQYPEEQVSALDEKAAFGLFADVIASGLKLT